MRRLALPWLRTLLAGLGLLAGAALIWFVGPLVAVAGVVPLASEPMRWAAIAALAVAALAHAVWRSATAAQRHRRLMAGLVAGAADVPAPSPATASAAPGAAEVALIGKRFEQAVNTLRRAPIGGPKRRWLGALSGRPTVDQLPWYIIIGAPGAGKTTALVNSGLEFPLAAQLGQAVVQGIGGTRNCDWWFSSEAVLIDTAGRYTTHDSDRAADRAAWFGFLALLVRYRPRRPINGVLLTISASDLLTASPARRLAHAGELRERIEELHAKLGISFPVYVLVTKADLLAGFMEFFADFDKDERSQVWGVTFPYQDDSTRDGPQLRMASDFAAIEKRLNDCLIERLRGEADRQRRAAIYAFPQQWRVLRQALFEFLQTLLGGLRAELRPCVRGVYFTSATQEGTPMDRALGGLVRALGLPGRTLPAARPSGKTFFVTRLLRDVVFAESGLAGTNLRWRRQRAALEAGLAGLAVVSVAAAAGLSWRAYVGQREHIAALGARLPALEQGVASARAAPASDLPALLPVLDSLARFGAEDAGGASDGAVLSLGLDRSDMLDSAADDAYQRALRDAFLPRVAARLEERLRAGDRDHVELIYDALKAYLMLFGGRNFDRDALRAYLLADWDATLPRSVGSERRQALRRHLERLLAGGEVGAPSNADPQLIAQARGLVASVAPAQRAYQRLKQMDFGAAGFSAEAAAGAAAPRVFVRASGRPLGDGIPALYSRQVVVQTLPERTQEVLRQFAREQSWVLGATAAGAGVVPGPAAQAGLVADVRRLVLADYAARWQAYLNDLRLAPTATLTATAEQAQLLARPDSPLPTLLRAAARELTLDVAPAGAADADDPLGARFDALRQFVAGQPSAVEAVQGLLGKLAAHLTAVDDALKRQALPPSSEVTRELAAAADKAPEPVRGMLAQLAATSAAQAFVALREPLSRELASDIAPQCARNVAGRYPLARDAREEVSREEFTRQFAAGGTLDAFFQRHLAPHVDTAARPWAYRRAQTGGRVDAAEALQPFQHAQAIRDSFFHDGGRRLGVPLEFRLLGLDEGIGEFTLDIDGQLLRFRPGAQAPQSLRWPGPNASGRVHLQIAPVAGAAGPGFEFHGPWALYRLLDRVRIEPGAASDRSLLVFDVEGRKARVEVRSPAALNPLSAHARQELEQFTCPKRL